MRLVGIVLGVALAVGCTTVRGYEGPKRSKLELAHVDASRPVLSSKRIVEPIYRIVSIDGKALPEWADRADVLPGEREIVVRASGPGAGPYTLERTLRIDAAAGATYRVQQIESEIDLIGAFTVERDGALVLDTEPDADELAPLELPELARGWPSVRWYRDDPGARSAGVWSVAYVPPDESPKRWSRRLELQRYRTTSEQPSLDAVAIDLERAVRTRYPDVAWSIGTPVSGGRVDRWSARGGEREPLSALSVLRTAPHGALVATYAVRGRELSDAEAEVWSAQLLATPARDVEEAE